MAGGLPPDLARSAAAAWMALLSLIELRVRNFFSSSASSADVSQSADSHVASE